MTSDYATWLAITQYDRRLRYMTGDYNTLPAITQHDWWFRYMIGDYATLMSDLRRMAGEA